MREACAVRCGARESDTVFKEETTCQTGHQHGGFQVLALAGTWQISQMAKASAFCYPPAWTNLPAWQPLAQDSCCLRIPIFSIRCLLGRLLCLAELQDNFATCSTRQIPTSPVLWSWPGSEKVSDPCKGVVLRKWRRCQYRQYAGVSLPGQP